MFIDLLFKYSHGSDTLESRMFEYITNDYINIFTYNNVTYIGLETERLRYNQDKQR